MKHIPLSPATPAPAQLLADIEVIDANPQKKVVRDGFTMPCEDHRLIEEIRSELLPAGIATTKSIILRAGLHALMRLSKESLLKILEEMPPTKMGRPSSGKDR